MKKRRKKRRKLPSASESTQDRVEEHSIKAEPSTPNSKSPVTDSGSQTSLNLSKHENYNKDDHGTNLSTCDKPSTTKPDLNDDQNNEELEHETNHGNKTPEILCKKVKASRFAQPQTTTLLKRASNMKETMNNNNLINSGNNNKSSNNDNMSIGYNTLHDEDETRQETMRLKKIRLAHRTEPSTVFSFHQSINNNHSTNFDTNTTTDADQDTVTTVGDLALPRERVISLCKIDKNELDGYLPTGCENDEGEDNSQEQDSELLQIFQAEGKTQADNRSSIPVLENYQLYSQNQSMQMRNSEQSKISALRNLLEQNLQNTQMLQSGGVQPEHTSGMGASSTLAFLSQRHNMHDLQQRSRNYPMNETNIRKIVPHNIPPNPQTRKNFGFVPIHAGIQNPHNPVETSPFVSPRATPTAKYKRNHNIAPLQMTGNQISSIGAQNTAFTRPIHFKQELPASAPSSPSLVGTFRYYSGQPANTASTIYTAENRSQSVPLHQQPQDDYSAYSSACNSVNPTPVPSEFRDFDDQSNLLEMFSSESGAVPNIKMETTDLMSTDFLENDDVTSSIDTVVSRSVPSTPLSCEVNNFRNSQKMCNRSNQEKCAQSVPTTPVNHSGTAFCYTPPGNRDFLINGYNMDQKLIDESNNAFEEQAPNTRFSTTTTATSSFMNSNEPVMTDFDTNSNQVSNNDSMIEADIFNEMT